MKKVFEPSELEIGIQNDPNRVIEIQGKVKDLLEGNPQRQEGIRQELLADGAWALPGLINSTYVWMNQFEGDNYNQEMLSSLMAELARDNQAAENLLAKAGVLDNPFDIPRLIAITALEKLDKKPHQEVLNDAREEIGRQKTLENYSTLLDLYKFLFLAHDDKDFNDALTLGKRWTEMKLDVAGKLLAVLIQSFPHKTEEILREFSLATQEDHRERNIAHMLIESLKPIPTDWLSENILVDVSLKVLDECNPPRLTMIEFLWTEVAKDYKQTSPETWMQQIERTGNKLQKIEGKFLDKIGESLFRYWFEALAYVGESQPVIEAAFSDNELWGRVAALQLCFGEKSGDPKLKKEFSQALEKLKVEKNQRYKNAISNYQEISSKKKGESDIKYTHRPGTIR